MKHGLLPDCSAVFLTPAGKAFCDLCCTSPHTHRPSGKSSTKACLALPLEALAQLTHLHCGACRLYRLTGTCMTVCWHAVNSTILQCHLQPLHPVARQVQELSSMDGALHVTPHDCMLLVGPTATEVHNTASGRVHLSMINARCSWSRETDIRASTWPPPPEQALDFSVNGTDPDEACRTMTIGHIVFLG